MKKLLIFFIFIYKVNFLYSQNSFNASSIPKPLLYKAGAVIRNSETFIGIKSKEQVILKKKCSVTILNSSGDEESTIVVWYDKSRKIKSIKGAVYNEFGVQASKFSEKDFSDKSAANDFSLYEDSRIKVLSTGLLTYPYTIEYEYEVRLNQSLSLPTWIPLYSSGTSIENSSLTVIYPLNFNMRFKEVNFKGTKEESTKHKNFIKWTLNSLEAIKDEPYSPEPETFLPIVKMAAEDFSYDEVKGKFSDWNEYGKWVNDVLLKNREELPDWTVFKIQELVKDIDSPKDKAKAIYEYMQQKTRYVSVQIGVGGFQPYPAQEVDKTGYGDCKGLVNYTKALLKIAGIESYYTVVNAGRYKEDVSKDFASINDGNHVILCLPFPQDTIWLECTNQKMPFGYLGDFTDDRLVIVCTPQGGKLLRTPILNYEINKQERVASFKLNEIGDITGSISTTFEGAQYDNHEVLAEEVYSEQIKLLSKLYPFPNLSFESISYKQEKTQLPVSIETIQLSSKKFAAVSSTDMVLSLNPLNKVNKIPKEIRNRTNPLHINRGYTDIDEYSYEIPEGFVIDNYSKKVSQEKSFGSYSTEIFVKGSIVTYKRTMKLKEGTYPSEQYQEFVEFYKNASQGDNAKLYLKKTI